MPIDYAVPGTTVQGPGAGQINTIGPGGVPTTTNLPGSSPTNVGSMSNSQGTNTSNSQSSGTSSNTSGSTSFIPDYVQQLNFLNQYGNMAGDLSQQQYKWAQDQFTNNSALTNQNINDYLKNSDMGFQGAGRDYANYNDIFTPAASSLTSDWQSYTSPERVASEMGGAEATQAQAFEGQRKNIERSLESYGINPSDPRYAGAMAANRTAEGASQAAAGTAARLNTENTGRQLRQSALNEAHLLPGQTATEQNVSMQGLTGASNAAFGNTSLGALTMGTTPQYMAQGVANNKFQPLGTVSQGAGSSQNQSTSAGNSQNTSNTTPILNTTPYTGFHYMAEGGAIPEQTTGGEDQGGGGVPASMSPSGGQQVDDIPAQIEQTGGAARLNAGEFVIPQDVTEWMGQKFFQDLIMKSRKARMANPGPAHATQGPGGEQHVMGGLANDPNSHVNALGNTVANSPPPSGGPGQVTGSVSTPAGTAPQGAAPAPQPPAPTPTPGPGPSPALPGPDTPNWLLPPPPPGWQPGSADPAGGQPDPAATTTPPPTVGAHPPAPAIPHQAPTNAPLPTGNQLMEGGDHSVKVQHNAPGSAGHLGQGLAAGTQPTNSEFQPQQSYFTPPAPFAPQPTPAFAPVPNTPPPPPPTNVLPGGAGATVTGGTGGGTGGGGGGSGSGSGGTPNVGAVGKGMNNDGKLHPMLPNDVDQLLTSGQQIADQNKALYAKWGIPMQSGVSFGAAS